MVLWWFDSAWQWVLLCPITPCESWDAHKVRGKESCCPNEDWIIKSSPAVVRSHFLTIVTILWLLMPPTYWCAKSFATNDHGIVYLDLPEVVPGFVDNFPRSSCAPAETETLLRRPRQPLYPNKHRVSRPRMFSNLNSRVPALLHFPTTWYTGSTQVRHL